MKILKVLAWIVGTPLVLFGLLLLARFVSCGPNSADVKVATPMVEKIADYIVTNGVPESLDSILDLPYTLKDCKRSIKYRKMGIPVTDVDSKDKADFSIITENCYFSTNEKSYVINLWFNEDYKNIKNTSGEVSIKVAKTYIGTLFEYKNNKLVHDNVGSGFDNRFGFCRQFRQ